MKILAVEDESRTEDYLKQRRTEAGFVIALAWDGLRAKVDGGRSGCVSKRFPRLARGPPLTSLKEMKQVMADMRPILRAHGKNVSVRSADGGTVFELRPPV